MAGIPATRTLMNLARRAAVPLACVVALVVLIRPNNIPHAPVLIALVLAVLAVALAVQTRGFLQNALVVATTLCIGFAIVEGYFETHEPNVQLVAPGMWAPDADFGIRAAYAGPREVHETIDGKPIYKVVYTLADTQRRLTRSSAEAPKARFFGDSFTFGVGLNDSDTLPQAFADLTGMNVENYGFPGFSPAQTLRAMQTGHFDPDLEGSKLLVLQTAPWHVERTACLPEWTEGAPRYVTVAGRLELKGRCRSRPWQSLASYQHLLLPLLERPTHADVATYIGVVDAIIDLARTKYKAPLLILSMERDEPGYLSGTGFTSGDLDAHFHANGAIVVADRTTARLASLRIPGDNHPNAVADRLLARAVAEAATAAGVSFPKPLPKPLPKAPPKPVPSASPAGSDSQASTR